MATLTINNTVCNFTPTIEYGLLYNWYVTENSSDIASDGWSVASLTDWNVLRDFLTGDKATAGGPLKETGFTYWYSPNTGATNEVDFNGRGAGVRLSNGSFSLFHRDAQWWADHSVDGQKRDIMHTGESLNEGNAGSLKAGSSIRLVKDSTTLFSGQKRTYTGNDGKVYQTVCIGTQEWLAENLAETKYRNGDIIPEVTDNTEWGNLTSGALCAYDNDWSYVGRAKPAYY